MSRTTRAKLRITLTFALIFGLGMIPFALLRTWWANIPAIVMMIVTARLALGPRALTWTGLKMRPRDLIGSVVCFAVAATIFYWVILGVSFFEGLTYKPVDSLTDLLQSRIWTIAGALSQEILFRAMLLTLCVSLLPRRRWISVTTAAFFALIHIPFSLIVDGELLSPVAVLTIFVFGIIVNELYFRTNHIGYTTALHAAWNMVKMCPGFDAGFQRLTQTQEFNAIEGSWTVLVAILALYAIVISLPHTRQAVLARVMTRHARPAVLAA